MIKKSIFFRRFILLIIIILMGIVCSKDNYNHPKSVNPHISDEAEALLDFLYQISGKYILSGHHNGIESPTKYSEEVKEMTGYYPVIWGSDFSFHFRGNNPDIMRQKMIDNAIEMYNKGHIITLMWHCCFPSDGDSCRRESIWVWDDIVPQAQWDSLTTPGTELNNQWRTQADHVAKYLKQLQETKIPVLWRPYHEMNGVWFWWCQHPGEEGFAKLWKMMYDYFTNHHQLNNLIWVWNANAPRSIPGDEAYSYKDYFPGIDYVDVLAADVYHNDYKQSHHDELLELAQGKPISLGEVGEMPTPVILDQQPHWVWFMGWANFLHKANKPDSVNALYNAQRTITLNEIMKKQDGSYKVQVK
jgi:mannan endo-1,4-beta-mannosidase